MYATPVNETFIIHALKEQEFSGSYFSAHLLLGNSLRKKLRNGGRWLMHWTTEFMKQVLPRLTNPVCPFAHTGPGSFNCARASPLLSLGVEPLVSV